MPRRFNEATTARSWNSPMILSWAAGNPGFNEATTARSWNCRAISAPQSPWPRFNEATTARSWNWSFGAKPASACGASMRPRPRGRGIPSIA